MSRVIADGNTNHFKSGSRRGTFAVVVVWLCFLMFSDPSVAGQWARPDKVAEINSGAIAEADASWWGFDPDDSTVFLQAAFDSPAEKVLIPERETPWITTPLTINRDDLEIFFEEGAVVEAKRGSFLGRNDVLLKIWNRTNIILNGYGATIQMHKKDYQIDPPYKRSEWRHCLDIRGSDNIKVLGLTLSNSGGDGIYISETSIKSYSENIVVQDVVCDKNSRQGISVISAEKLLVQGCVFMNTLGAAPMSGIDLEPNKESQRLVDIVIRDSLFYDNALLGMHVWLGNLTSNSLPVSVLWEGNHVKGGEIGIHVGNIGDSAPSGYVKYRRNRVEGTGLAGILLRRVSSQNDLRIEFEENHLINTAVGQVHDQEVLDYFQQRYGMNSLRNWWSSHCPSAPIVMTAQNHTNVYQGGISFDGDLIVHAKNEPLVALGIPWTSTFNANVVPGPDRFQAWDDVSGNIRTVAPEGAGISIKSHLRDFDLVLVPVARYVAGGDDVAYVEQDGVFYRVHIFRESGTLEVAEDGEIEYLLVAGGGGGGSTDYNIHRCPGGGGAGGILTGRVSLAAGSYPIAVGAGGVGGYARAAGGKGGDTTAFGLTAIGGGGGGDNEKAGMAGGSGGGAGTTSKTGGDGTAGQGFPGGDSGSGAYSGGGGGGGASEAGKPPVSSDGGDGGRGIDLSQAIAFGIDSATFGVGEDGWFAGGGGGVGGTDKRGGWAGRGGGGGGGSRTMASYGFDGVPGSGGGGGGGSSRGGYGGGGAVLVRYAIDASQIPYVDIEATELKDMYAGNNRFTSSNKVAVAAIPVPEGYDLFQITVGNDPENLGSNWDDIGQLPAMLTFERPSADTNLTWSFWFTNSVAEVTLKRSQGNIFYTEVRPHMVVRPFVHRFLAPGEEAEVALSDFQPPRGGKVMGTNLQTLEPQIVLAGGTGTDLTAEDPSRVTLAEPGSYPLEISFVNELGIATNYSSEAIIQPLPDEKIIFTDHFKTGGWADSDYIAGFWTRSMSTLVAELFLGTEEGRFKWYIESLSGNHGNTFRSANRDVFNFSQRKIILRLTDVDLILPVTHPGSVNWRVGIGFSSTPGKRIDAGYADSLHFVLAFSAGFYTITLYDGATSLGQARINGTTMEGTKMPIPCNFIFEVDPSEAALKVELSDGSERLLSGYHSLDIQNAPWIAAPSLNMYLHSGSTLERDNPHGFSADSIMVTTPKPGTLMMVR